MIFVAIIINIKYIFYHQITNTYHSHWWLIIAANISDGCLIITCKNTWSMNLFLLFVVFLPFNDWFIGYFPIINVVCVEICTWSVFHFLYGFLEVNCCMGRYRWVIGESTVAVDEVTLVIIDEIAVVKDTLVYKEKSKK